MEEDIWAGVLIFVFQKAVHSVFGLFSELEFTPLRVEAFEAHFDGLF
jgi:hypothetical protein